ncbi:MAG: GMC family oxidoreductase N-terminal domain-containing protein [Polynucleobacter sp.]|jgi:choline dehydrogenase|nr:GMC family oxidoreductase N-terminal domain-containing protein [Polynucleobacter sp.]
MAEIDHGKFDYIIVGAGSAGCVLANRLTQNPDVTVLLLEAGAKDDYHWIHIPVGYLYCINNPRTDWQFKTEALPGLNGRSLLYPRGRVLGGSSSINGMIYMRGQDQNYAEWARLTNDHAWDWERCLERFKQFEDYHGDVNQWHSTGSEWTVSQQRLRWEILEVFKDAAIEAGIPQTNDFNRGNNWGVGYFDVNQRNGLRLNASKAFLKKASGRPNLTIITGALVKRLQVDSSTRSCSAVAFFAGDQQHVASVGHEALLCAGAVGSVQILERSGIGQGPLLQNMGIPVVSHLPGVGENLQDHLQLRMVYQVTGIKTLNTQIRSVFGRVQIGLQYLLNRSGPMSMAPSQLGAFAFSSAHYQLPNLQYHVQPLSLDKFGEDLHSFNAFTASVCNLQPSSRGSIHIVSADTHTPPRIDPNYLATSEDQQVALDAMRLTRKIVSQPSLKPYSPREYKPGAHLVNDDELRHAAGEIGTTIFHPVGTCKMGSLSDPQAVLDSQMRVIGVKGLRVVDASAMPTITSGNTAAPTMMIAIRAAELLMA